MMSKLPKTRLTIYEFKGLYTGLSDEIAEKHGFKESSVIKNSLIIGYMYPEVKAVEMKTGETFFGTIDDAVMFSGLTERRVSKILRQNQSSPNWKFTYTGEYIEKSFMNKRKEEKKELKRKQPITPMSEYGKQLFEHSTRHLRRDA